MYTHSPQQYSYIYFPELASLQTLKTLISHLQHFTQCICIPPQQYSYIYFPELASFQTLKHHHTYNILPSVYTHSPQQYSYIYFPELASFQTLKLITLTTFYPVYIHIPHSSTHTYTFLNCKPSNT